MKPAATAGWFVAWALSVAGCALAVSTGLDARLAIASAVILLTLVLLVRRSVVGLPGVIAGLSAPLFVEAYRYTTAADVCSSYGNSCVSHGLPSAWLAGAGALLLSGVAVAIFSAAYRSEPSAVTTATPPRPAPTQGPIASAAWFVAWMIVGGGFVLGTLTLLSIGVLVDAVAIALLLLLLSVIRYSVVGTPGAISGLSLPLFFVGYLNRGGPGDVCTYSTMGSQCSSEMSPWPWIVVGTVLLAGGVGVMVAMTRARRTADRHVVGSSFPLRLP